jgi:hypothetical protein
VITLERDGGLSDEAMSRALEEALDRLDEGFASGRDRTVNHGRAVCDAGPSFRRLAIILKGLRILPDGDLSSHIFDIAVAAYGSTCSLTALVTSTRCYHNPIDLGGYKCK